MDERFQENIHRFQQLSPSAAIKVSYADCEGLSFCETKKKEPNLKLHTSENDIIFYHSSDGALQEAKKWFANADKNADVFFIYGIGLGYYYLAAKTWLKQKKNRTLIFLEDDFRVIHRLFETDLGTEILHNSRVEIVYFTGPEIDKETAAKLAWQCIDKKVSFAALPLYENYRKGEYKNIQTLLSHEVSQKEAFAKEYLMGGVPFFNNYYHNLWQLPSAFLANGFWGKFKGVPAVICGAGPSLDKNIDEIKKIKKKVLLFAGGSAVNALNAQGVQPHFGGIVDPNPLQLQRIQENKAESVPYFYRNRAYYEALKAVKGPKVFVPGSSGYNIAQWVDRELGIEEVDLEEGYNVINFLIYIAYTLGCNPILLVGLDLAFTHNHSYAAGIVENPAEEAKKCLEDAQEKPVLELDIFGNPVYTLWKWKTESVWISNFATEHPNVLLINATEGGIGFKDITNQSLKTLNLEIEGDKNLEKKIEEILKKTKIHHIDQEKIREVEETLLKSFIHCIQIIKTLEKEKKTLKRNIEEGFSESLENGKTVLLETELSEEIAYIYVLEMFNSVYKNLLYRKIRSLQLDPIEEKKRSMRKLRLQLERLNFLKTVCLVNKKLLIHSLQSLSFF